MIILTNSSPAQYSLAPKQPQRGLHLVSLEAIHAGVVQGWEEH